MEKKIESLIREHKIIAILRGVPSDKVVDVAKALYDGGVRLLEITFNQKSETKLIDTPNAIRAVREALGDKMVIGAGTVMSVEEVHAAKEAGVEPIYRALSMKDAVEQGYKLAARGDIVLLSPACSSFDWYSCFEERGDDFKNCVHMLQEGRHH